MCVEIARGRRGNRVLEPLLNLLPRNSLEVVAQGVLYVRGPAAKGGIRKGSRSVEDLLSVRLEGAA